MNEDLLDDFNQGTDELPQMLNVVTILTFIGSGLAILMSSYRLITKTKQIDSLNDTIVLLEKSDSQNFLMDSALQGIKLNIEGAEYELLEEIIDSEFQDKIDGFLIQFHYLSHTPIKRREKIINKLKETHEPVFYYPFVWEYWKKK